MRLQYEFLEWCEYAWADELGDVVAPTQARAVPAHADKVGMNIAAAVVGTA